MRGTLQYYAWTYDGTTVYTLTVSPSEGTAWFSEPSVAGGSVAGTGDGYLAIEDGGSHYLRDTSEDATADKWRPLLTPSEMEDLTRMEYGDDAKLEALIREVEMHVKAVLGDDLYISLVTNPPSSAYDTLLDGGVYTTSNGRKSFEGLKTAIAYYAYAKLLKSDVVPTRYGAADKRSQYSDHSALTERQKQSREALELADRHLQDCIDYVYSATDFVSDTCKPPVRFVSQHSLRFHIIGDTPRRRRRRGGTHRYDYDFNEDYNDDYNTY